MSYVARSILQTSAALIVGVTASTSGYAEAVKTEVPSSKTTPQKTGETRGFAFTYFWYAMSYGADDCPDGLAIALPGGINPPPLYDGGRKGREVSRPRGPSGEDDQCTNPTAFEDPPMRTGKGRTAYGMNLDEGAEAESCPHENYTGVDGTRGVDNQLYRVLGCINAYRPESHFQGNVVRDFVVSARQDGQVTTLLEITGIDDPRNDSDVTVGLYSSSNPTHYDAERKGVPYTSLTVNKNPRWHNLLRGKIVDGVVITEPGDIRLDHYQGEGLKDHTDMYIRGARLRLTLKPDGGMEGTMAGYSDLEAAYRMEFAMGPSVLPKSWGWTCPSAYAAMKKLADGYRDQKTGQCTALSTAYRIEAVPAFVIHPTDEAKAVQAER
jgi:hypothetical protein